MSQTFRIGPARLLTASSFDAPIPSWTDLGLSRGNAVVTLSHTDKSVGRADQQTPGLTDAVYQTPSPMEIRFMMTDRDVLKLVQAFPLSARLTSGAKTALGITTTPARITSRAFALVPQEDYSVEGSFLGSEFVAYFKDAYLSIDSIPVATPIEDTDDALSQTAFEIRIVRVLGSESGYGYPLATGQSFQGVLFAYQPSQDALSPLIGSAATFSRASTATYVDANGIIQTATTNTPRYQDGGLLLEPQRTNHIGHSAVFTSWTIRGAVIVTSAAATSPTGAADATKIEDIGSPGINDLYLIETGITASAAISPSVYIKKISETGTLGIRNPQGIAFGEWAVNFALLGDGWERITKNHPAVTQSNAWVANGAGQAGIQIHNTSGSPDFYIFGAQLEEGAYPTSYIPSSGGANATRNADVFSAPRPSGLSVQSDFSAIINAVPLFGDGQEAVSEAFRLFGDSTPRFNALYPQGTPDEYYTGVAIFSLGTFELSSGTVTKDEDMEALFVSDTDGDLTYTIYEGGTADTPDTITWSAVKNATDEFGGTKIIQYNNGAWILKSFIVTSGLLTYDQIRSVLR